MTYGIFQDNCCVGGKTKATFTVCELGEGAYIAPAGYPVGKYRIVCKRIPIGE